MSCSIFVQTMRQAKCSAFCQTSYRQCAGLYNIQKDGEIRMKKLIGNKAFYKGVLAIAIPIMLQNGITNFVGLLDNIMVGRVGTEQMSGVSIVNQLIFVFNLCIFGGISGAGIFGAQFYGQKNMKGVRDTFRFKLVMCVVILIGTIALFLGYDTQLISLYLHEGTGGGDLAATLLYGERYLKIMLIGLLHLQWSSAIPQRLGRLERQ